MNDFNGSVAQQDVTITTEVKKTSVVGGNYYENVLYVTDRFESFGGDTPVYPVVTKATYEDVLNDYAYFSATEKKIIKGNLDSLFAYGVDKTVYIIPSTEVANYKLYAYFTYLDLEWLSTAGGDEDYTLTGTSIGTVNNVKNFDKDFTALITEFPVDPTKVKGTSTTTTAATLAQLTSITDDSGTPIDIAVFARPAIPTGALGTVNCYLDGNGDNVSASPCLYQLGWTLDSANESGVPVANTFDMKALNFLNVLPTAETSTDILSGAGSVFANWFETNYVNYFKPVGNGTMNLDNYGGWTTRANCVVATWIVAYENYMNRVGAATVISSGKALKDPRTYSTILDMLKINMAKMIATGRIANYQITAPSFGQIPSSNGHTIIIPHAWEGDYVDNVRKVRISGTLYVAM